VTLHLVCRRISRFAMVAIAALSLAWQAAPAAAAATSGTLFGLGPRSVLTIDPATGASSTFVGLPTVDAFPGASFSSLTSDARGHRLFTERTVYAQQPDGTLGASYQIVTINTADATAAPSVSADMASGVTQLGYDASSGTLYGQTNMYPFELVGIDPSTGVETHVADLPGLQPLFMAVAPGKHTIYMPIEDFSQFPAVNTIATIDTSTGAVSQSGAMAAGIFALVYDSGTGALYGKTFCCPANIVKVDAATGAQSTVATGLPIGSGITIDSTTHTIFMTDDELGAYGFNQFIASASVKTGAVSTSTGALPSDTYVGSLAFQGAAITPDSIIADVNSAVASGAITNGGVATSLIAELTQAKAALGRGNCTAAAGLYNAFIRDASAQSGKTIAPGTASQLISEAQFLGGSC